ncbi:hypothetical protein [Halomonas sp.]|uniref:hypothetical protein n=1 Tax=unclassified Halomonas TaxID=2609666 RepID=UPI003F933D28
MFEEANPPNSSGTINNFNNRRFGNGVKVTISHQVNGGRNVIQLADKIIASFHYAY